MNREVTFPPEIEIDEGIEMIWKCFTYSKISKIKIPNPCHHYYCETTCYISDICIFRYYNYLNILQIYCCFKSYNGCNDSRRWSESCSPRKTNHLDCLSGSVWCPIWHNIYYSNWSSMDVWSCCESSTNSVIGKSYWDEYAEGDELKKNHIILPPLLLLILLNYLQINLNLILLFIIILTKID